MRQIAERAGVNRSTVSLALRNDVRLKLSTRQRIQALANEMGYRQNPMVAQLMTQLRAGQQKHFQSTIAFLDFGPLGFVQRQTWEGAEARAKFLGYGLEYFHVRDVVTKRLEQILINRGIRGLIISSPAGTTRLPDKFRSLWARFACCVLGVHPNNPELHFSCDDNYLTSMIAVQRLSQLGYKRIGLAMHATINSETNYRFVAGYLATHLEQSCLETLPIFYVHKTSRDQFLSWFRQYKPEVVMCIQEEILVWLKESGYHIPQDVSLVHLDVETASAGWAGMRQMRAQVGSASVDIVVSQINHNETGTPPFQKATLTESVWDDGPSLALLTPPKKIVRPNLGKRLIGSAKS